jgi:hypothetical protein
MSQKNFEKTNFILISLGTVCFVSIIIFYLLNVTIKINVITMILTIFLFLLNKINTKMCRFLISIVGVLSSIFSGLAATPPGKLIVGSYYSLSMAFLLLPFVVLDKNEKILRSISTIINFLLILGFPYFIGLTPNVTEYTLASSLPVQTVTNLFALIIAYFLFINID